MVRRECLISINGVRHWCSLPTDCSGEVPPLVIVHGGPGGNNYNFQHTIGPQLEEAWPVIYYEQRGCGRSELPSNQNDYSKRILVSDFVALCKELALTKVIPLGYSFGGELAMEIALQAPNLVDKLILQCPSIDDPERLSLLQICGFELLASGNVLEQIENIKDDDGSFQEKCARVWALVGGTELVDSFLFVDKKNADLNRRLWKKSGLTNTGLMAKALELEERRRPLLQRITEITAPTLVLAGFYDRNIGLDVFKDINTQIPNSELVLFHNSAHFPDIEESQKYVDVIRRFLVS